MTDSPLQVASKMLTKLGKLSGEAHEKVLALEQIAASETLVIQLRSAATSLAAQHKALGVPVRAKVNDASRYTEYLNVATSIINYYQEKLQFANAHIGVAKRQVADATTAAAAAAAAAAKAAGPP